MRNTASILLILFIIGVLPMIPLQAEGNFKAGYIITNSKDTIKGFISQVNVDAYTRCSFKMTLDGNVTDYNPGEISAYRFGDDGMYFISKQIQTADGTKVLFIEYLIKGNANIYFMRDHVDHYYIETENNKLMELSEPETRIEKKDGLTYLKPASYFGKLKFMLSDCPDIYPEIDKLKLEPQSLITLAKDYHTKVCTTEQCVIFESKSKPIKLHLGIMVGASLNSFDFQKGYTNYAFGSLMGLKLELENLFFNSKQSLLQVGLVMNKFSTYTFYLRDNYYFYYNDKYITSAKTEGVDINTYALKIPVTYNYLLSLGKIRPYIGVGLDNTLLLSQNKNLYINYFAKDASFPIWSTGFVANTGVRSMMKNGHFFSMELSYEYTRSLIANPLFGLQNSIFSLSAGYTL